MALWDLRAHRGRREVLGLKVTWVLRGRLGLKVTSAPKAHQVTWAHRGHLVAKVCRAHLAPEECRDRLTPMGSRADPAHKGSRVPCLRDR